MIGMKHELKQAILAIPSPSLTTGTALAAEGPPRDRLLAIEEELSTIKTLLLRQTPHHQVLQGSAIPEMPIRLNNRPDVGSPLVGSHPLLDRSSCPCSCRSHKRIATPSFLKWAFGQFIGHADLPVMGGKCDTPGCERRQAPRISAEYWLPVGFYWPWILRLTFAYKINMGPSLQLDTLRHVPDTAACVTFAFTGNIQALKGLFSRGLASPRDVSLKRGYSLLKWALYGRQYKTAKFLLDNGADPTYCPKARNEESPRQKAHSCILKGGLASEDIEVLRVISDRDNYADSQNPSSLHCIVIGLSPGDLGQELDRVIARGNQVDVCDNGGRTPLYWAAPRGDKEALITLLKFGADPNYMANNISTPLSVVAYQGHTNCARILLEAGARVTLPIPKGIIKGSPLNYAARSASDLDILRVLLDYGAELEGSCMDGMTPLLNVARRNSAAHATILLDYGANINATSRSGQTPLTTAIEYNNHDVLEFFLRRWLDYFARSDSTEKRRTTLNSTQILEVVAKYADFKTLDMLLAESAEPFRSILSCHEYGRGYYTGIAIPGMPHFQELLAARAAEFSDFSIGDKDSITTQSPSLSGIITAFEGLLFSLRAPSAVRELGFADHSRDHQAGEEIPVAGVVNENEVDGDDDDGDDDLLVFEDAEEY